MITTKKASLLVGVAIIIFAVSAFWMISKSENAYEIMNQRCATAVAIAQTSSPDQLQEMCREAPEKYMANQYQALSADELEVQMKAIEKLRQNSCKELLISE